MLDSGAPIIKQVIKKLRDLNEACARWTIGRFEDIPMASRASGESKPTMDRFGADRNILCPDGQTRLFELHIRFTPGANRIYFFPDSSSHMLFIGHIGEKPPSVTDPT